MFKLTTLARITRRSFLKFLIALSLNAACPCSSFTSLATCRWTRTPIWPFRQRIRFKTVFLILFSIEYYKWIELTNHFPTSKSLFHIALGDTHDLSRLFHPKSKYLNSYPSLSSFANCHDHHHWIAGNKYCAFDSD